MAQPQTQRVFTTQSPEGVPGAKPRPHFTTMVQVRTKSFRGRIWFVKGRTPSSVQQAQRAQLLPQSDQSVFSFNEQRSPHHARAWLRQASVGEGRNAPEYFPKHFPPRSHYLG